MQQKKSKEKRIHAFFQVHWCIYTQMSWTYSNMRTQIYTLLISTYSHAQKRIYTCIDTSLKEIHININTQDKTEFLKDGNIYLLTNSAHCRHMWCNSYYQRKWIWQTKFKPWMRLFAFYFLLVPLGNAWNHLFFPSLSSQADWAL